MEKEFNLSKEKVEKSIFGYYPEEKIRLAVRLVKEDLRKCDEFFNVEDYSETVTTDKFMGIVELFLNKRFGDELNGK